ncbi:hypothetical protein SCOCK_100093 [Actinacidiphila cocklensis]|uniref:Uncharacterized protein n=1 Tax=Actinacidiphila cocklensis TaxID=887465 RepID=A0A9W4DIU1_9ACTN|nr:hypothetical protein SCOCK_100093 [Actinacidiphila cocklensis]
MIATLPALYSRNPRRVVSPSDLAQRTSPPPRTWGVRADRQETAHACTDTRRRPRLHRRPGRGRDRDGPRRRRCHPRAGTVGRRYRPHPRPPRDRKPSRGNPRPGPRGARGGARHRRAVQRGRHVRHGTDDHGDRRGRPRRRRGRAGAAPQAPGPGLNRCGRPCLTRCRRPSPPPASRPPA